MAKKKLLLIIFCLFFLTCILSCDSVLAASVSEQFNKGLNDTAQGAGYTAVGALNQKDPSVMIGRIVQVILAFLGVLFMILMIYGGFIWMTARGNEQNIQKAQSIIRNSLIGLVIVLSAYTISIFVMSKLSTETLKTQTTHNASQIAEEGYN